MSKVYFMVPIFSIIGLVLFIYGVGQFYELRVVEGALTIAAATFVFRTSGDLDESDIVGPVFSTDKAIGANPLKWKLEHRARLVTLGLVGAAVGLAVGYATTHSPWSGFGFWLETEAAFWWGFTGSLALGVGTYLHVCSKTVAT